MGSVIGKAACNRCYIQCLCRSSTLLTKLFHAAKHLLDAIVSTNVCTLIVTDHHVLSLEHILAESEHILAES